MITDIEKKGQKRPSLSWYRERLDDCIERERLNHSYKRALLLEALYEQEHPVSVEELYFSMGQAGYKSISINTIYRIIKLLISFGMVVRVAVRGTPKYVLGTSDEWKADFVCRDSGESYRIDLPQAWRFALEELLEFHGIELVGGLEIRGECIRKQNK